MEAQDLDTDTLWPRLAFLSMDTAGCEVLRRRRPIREYALEPALDRFYALVRSRPELRRFFRDDSHMDVARRRQFDHWMNSATGRFDELYLHTMQSVVATHARIGLGPKWYVGAYALALESLLRALLEALRGVSLVGGTSEVPASSIRTFGEPRTRVSGIAHAAETQAVRIGEISSAIGYLDQMTQQNAATVEETSAAGAAPATEADSFAAPVARLGLGE